MTIAAAIHTAAVVAFAGGIALVVYEFVGIGVLRGGWLNVDRIWAYASVRGAAVTLLVG